MELRAEQRERWARSRYAVLRGALDETERARLRDWADELATWPETAGKWMKYFEGPERRLCRVENFLPYHAGLASLLARPDLLTCLEALLGERPFLFKEKLNYKLPGGAGFVAHQDAPAFASFDQHYHVSVMVSVDDAGPDNGCLEIVEEHRDPTRLPEREDGTLAPQVETRLAWRPLRTRAGDVVFFDSYVPHRSPANHSGLPRRALYLTYNRASDGDRRADYFALKRRVFPPECERAPGGHPAAGARRFNVGNPIR